MSIPARLAVSCRELRLRYRRGTNGDCARRPGPAVARALLRCSLHPSPGGALPLRSSERTCAATRPTFLGGRRRETSSITGDGRWFDVAAVRPRCSSSTSYDLAARRPGDVGSGSRGAQRKGPTGGWVERAPQERTCDGRTRPPRAIAVRSATTTMASPHKDPGEPRATRYVASPPRYASLSDRSAASSLARPDATMRPFWRTYPRAAASSASVTLCSTRRMLVPVAWSSRRPR